MAERLAVAAVVAADARLDQAAPIVSAAAGDEKSSVADVEAKDRGRPWNRIRGCSGRPAVPRDGVAHERAQFLVRDLHERRPDR